ncbi:MAG: OB-fold domain-containing protein [Candidatus Lokiarchaeota archaeon]|jgi:uncharacterized OB-fold protein
MIIDERIKAKKCDNCGLIQHYSHLRCLNCRNERFEEIEASGECRLVTFTILTAVPQEFLEKKPYALGIVEFENGVRALGQINNKENLRSGMKLKTLLKQINIDGKQVDSYIFEPILS